MSRSRTARAWHSASGQRAGLAPQGGRGGLVGTVPRARGVGGVEHQNFSLCGSGLRGDRSHRGRESRCVGWSWWYSGVMKTLYKLHINEDDLNRLNVVKEASGIPVAEQIRRGIALWLERSGQDFSRVPERVRRDTTPKAKSERSL